MQSRAHYVTICCRFHCHQSHDLQQLLFQRPVRFNNHRRGLWMGQTKRSLHVPKSWTLLIFLVSIAQHCLNYQLPIPITNYQLPIPITNTSIAHRRGLWMGQTKRSLHVPKSWTLLIFLVSIAQTALLELSITNTSGRCGLPSK